MMWTEFDPATGRIRQTIVGVQLVEPTPSASLGILEDAYGDNRTQYVSGGALVNRPATSITSVQAGAVLTLSNVALGTIVHITGDAESTVTQDATDGGLQLTFSTAGKYTIAAEQFPELPFSLDITTV